MARLEPHPGLPSSAARDAAGPAPAADAGRLESVVFTTHGVEPRHRFDLWCSKYESFNTLSPLDPVREGFDGCNEIWNFGSLALLRNSAPPLTFERTMRHIRRDSIDHWVVRVMRSGGLRLRLGEQVFRLSRGQMLVFSLEQPHAGDRSDASWLSLYIPRDSFPELSAGLGRLGNRILDTPAAGLLADYMTMLERRMTQASLAELPALVEGTRAMVAACLLEGVARPDEARQNSELTQFERIRAVIRQHIASPTLGPDKLCRLAGMSRSQLYRLFEPHGGVARYVQLQRLRLAHAMLGDPASRLPVAAIAERAGFFDASAFSRAFRQEFGYTPTEARAAFAAAPLAAPAALPKDPDFVEVMRHLGRTDRAEPIRT